MQNSGSSRYHISFVLMIFALLTASGQVWSFPLRALTTDREDETHFSLLISTAEPEALQLVRGLRLRSCQDEICTAEVILRELDLEALERHAHSVESLGRRRPMLDLSLPAAGVSSDLRSQGLTGAGVLIAVIDTGLDWRHDDFIDEAGQTRVELLLDLSTEPQGAYPELEARLDGAIWSRHDINAHLDAQERGVEPEYPVELRDSFGHGTHVASIAAGRLGVAPESSIFAARVNPRDWPVFFDDADVIDAVRLAFDVARELDMPAVVVLSLGGHQGPHDGTSLLERALDELVGADHPGRAIVVAAGNSGHCQDHAASDLDGDVVEVDLEITGEDDGLEVDLELWYSPGSALTVALHTPTGESLGPLAGGEDSSWSGDSAWVVLDNAAGGPDERNGDMLATLSLRSQLRGPIEPGIYRVIVSGRGHFDAYLSWSSEEQMSGAARLLTALEPDGTLTVPGTSPGLITVGATVSRRGWLDVAGRDWFDDRLILGGVAPYSGSGPTRSGGLKPDLVAPGHVILAALSQDATPGEESSVFTPSSGFFPDRYMVVAPGNRAALRGTSLAAPHVAGVIALLLQLDPELTQEQLRSLLIASARTAGGAHERAWNQRWGFGEVDAAAAVELLLAGFTDGEVSPTQTALGVVNDVLAPGECTVVTALPKDDAGRSLGPDLLVRFSARAGIVGEAKDELNGVYTSLYCTGSAPLSSSDVLSVSVAGVNVESQIEIFIAEDRHHLGAWATTMGGCEVVGPGRCSDLGFASFIVSMLPFIELLP